MQKMAGGRGKKTPARGQDIRELNNRMEKKKYEGEKFKWQEM